MSLHILVVLLISLFVSACGTMRAPSLNMLDRRSDYTGENRASETLDDLDRPLLVPDRTKPQITDIWIHPHEMPTGDYFRGGWIRTIVTDSQWEMERANKPLVANPKKKRVRTKESETKK